MYYFFSTKQLSYVYYCFFYHFLWNFPNIMSLHQFLSYQYFLSKFLLIYPYKPVKSNYRYIYKNYYFHPSLYLGWQKGSYSLEGLCHRCWWGWWGKFDFWHSYAIIWKVMLLEILQWPCSFYSFALGAFTLEFLIDQEYAQLDDALSATRLLDGRIKVWIHVADPTSLVQPGSIVDR